ncbi:MAG: ATP-binding protein [Dehalobacterium sp.]
MNDLDIELSSESDKELWEKSGSDAGFIKRANKNYICSINKQLSDILKNTNEGLMILNDQLQLIYINEIAKLLLHPANLNFLIGRELSAVFSKSSVMYQEISKAHAKQRPVHFEYHTIEQQFFEIDVFPHREGVLVYLHDMIYRGRSKKVQHYGFERIIDIMDEITEGFLILDSSWNFVYLNSEAGEFFAQLPGRLFGKEIWSEFPQLMGTEIEKKYRKSMDDQSFLCFETRGLLTDKWYEQQVFPSPKGITVYLKNITDRKRLEMEITRLDRLNSVGEMAASIGHEIRNPMTTVRGFLQLLGDKEECQKFKETFTLMIEELDRCNSMITEFLSFAGKREHKSEWCNLNDLIEAIKPLILADALMTDKNIVFELSAIPNIILDRNEIRQLILNLTRNGLEAMSSGKTLFIRTLKEINHVTLQIEDQGCGIDSSILDKLGTPFVTTKQNGTGLGLAVCYHIAAQHNATINYKTGNEGTTFSIRFNVD